MESIESQQPPVPPSYSSHARATYQPVTVKEWLITQLVLCIPVVGLIMIFVWAFSEATHPSKRSFFQSILVFWAILAGLGLLLALMFMLFGVGLAVFSSGSSSF